MKPAITSRDDLPFATRTATDEFDPWQPERHDDCAQDGVQYGLDAVAAIGQLAEVDEYEAHTAFVQVLLAQTFHCKRAEERGFIEGLARLAMIGLRAQAQTEPLPFDAHFDPMHAQWCSLNTRADLMEMHLRMAMINPWRTYEDAGKA